MRPTHVMVASAAFCLLACNAAAIAQDKIRIGLSSVSALHSALWVAEQKGVFRKNGLDTEIIVTGQGANTGISALLANDIQFTTSGGDAIVNSTLRGADTVMIAASINRGLNRIMARQEVKTPADLKGRKVGVSRLGAVSHSVLLMMLKRWNINSTDLQVLQLGSSPNMLAALEKGGVDAAVMTLPFVLIAEDRGSRVLVDMAETDIFYLHTMIATTRSYARSHRDITLRFLRGFVEGIAYFKQNKKESLEVVRKKLRISIDQERNLERSYDLLATKYYEAMPYPSLRGVETVLGMVEKDNPKAKTADPKSFIDDSLLREIDQSGLVKTLYQR